jgi:hypothetical protein
MLECINKCPNVCQDGARPPTGRVSKLICAKKSFITEDHFVKHINITAIYNL